MHKSISFFQKPEKNLTDPKFLNDDNVYAYAVLTMRNQKTMQNRSIFTDGLRLYIKKGYIIKTAIIKL